MTLQTGRGSWLIFFPVHRSTRSGYFEISGTGTPTNQLFPVQVSTFSSFRVLHGWSTVVQHNNPDQSLTQFINTLGKEKN
jgi:hypothetical protein